MDRRQAVGRLGEELAARFLEEKGFQVVERNFRCRLGELDLIGWDKQTLVFVEVRTRSSTSFASPEESVNQRKQQRLRRLAAWYQAAIIRHEVDCRFDVITVLLSKAGKIQKINHLVGAF